MKLVNLQVNSANTLLSRRIYAACWRPFAALWKFALELPKLWGTITLIALAVSYGLGGLLLLLGVFIGRFDLATVAGVFAIATVAGLTISTCICVLVLLVRSWHGLFRR